MNTTPKRYFHDRLVLLLLTASFFLAILNGILIAWNLSGGRNEGYIVQYRPNLGLNTFKKGDSLEIVSFGIFALIVLVFHLFLSIKIYSHRRSFAVIVLGAGLLLIVLSFVITNSLLLLR